MYPLSVLFTLFAFDDDDDDAVFSANVAPCLVALKQRDG